MSEKCFTCKRRSNCSIREEIHSCAFWVTECESYDHDTFSLPKNIMDALVMFLSNNYGADIKRLFLNVIDFNIDNFNFSIRLELQ